MAKNSQKYLPIEYAAITTTTTATPGTDHLPNRRQTTRKNPKKGGEKKTEKIDK